MLMDILRCKTPELVRKEIWTHILAYKLIRTILAQAAANHASSREQSASKERCKRWKRFNHSSPFKLTATGGIGETFTSNSSTLSQLIALPTGQIAMNRDYVNAGRRNTIRCFIPGT